MSAKLYADLSRIAAGEATILFLADVPDQVRFLTFYGRLKMGFRNPDTGEEVEFTTIESPPLTPTASLQGPREDGAIGLMELNGRGYVDVAFDQPAGERIEEASILDLADEFTLTQSGVALALDPSQQPLFLRIDGTQRVYRYFVQGGTPGADITIVSIPDSWVRTNLATGEKLGAPDTPTLAPNGNGVGVRYIDVGLAPTEGHEVEASTVGADDFTLGGAGAGISISATTPTLIAFTRIYRYYLTGPAFTAGDVTVTFAAGSWSDTAGASSASGGQFRAATPLATLAGPFTDGGRLTVVTINTLSFHGSRFVDVVFTPTPGADLDYGSILDADDEFELTIGGAPVSVDGTPIPIETVPDDTDPSGMVSTEFVVDTGAGAATVQKQLADAGIQQFRYLLGITDHLPGLVEVLFLTGSWQDTGGNLAPVQAAVTSRIDGPTATLADPANGQTIDANIVNGRGYIDITIPEAPAGWTIDRASVTDLEPEFELGGPGLGTAAIDGSQAPVFMGAAAGGGETYRYYLTGEVVLGESLTVQLLYGGWKIRAAATAGASHIDITFPSPAGSTIDAPSILDPGTEIILGGSGLGGAVLSSAAPVQQGDSDVYRYSLDGVLVAGDITIEFQSGTWATSNGAGDLALARGPPATSFTTQDTRTYLDVQIGALPGGTLAGVDGDELQMDGAIVDGAPIALNATGLYRYFLTRTGGRFEPGAVTVTFLGDSFSSVGTTTYANVAETQSFTVVGPVAALVGPSDGSSTGVRQLNDRGFIDVSIVAPAGKTLIVVSVTDLDAELSLGTGACLDAAGSLCLDATQAPLLLSQTGDTSVFRYWTRGAATSSALIVTFLLGSFEVTDGTTVEASTDVSSVTLDLDVGGVLTPNIGYLDARLLATLDDEIDLASLTDAEDELAISGSGAGDVAQISTVAPVRLAGTSIYRFFVTGSFVAGAVDVVFGAGVVTSGANANLERTERFVIAQPTAALADPAPGGRLDIAVINGRDYIDVRFTPPGAGGLDADSITDADAEFELTGPGVGTIALDGSRAPVIQADGKTVRYFLTGQFADGLVTVTFIDGSWRDAAGNDAQGAVALFEVVEPLPQETATQVFFIDLSGGMELRLGDLFDEPILEVRGKASFEAGLRTLAGVTKAHLSFNASGTIKVIKIGNLASGAAAFTMEITPGVLLPEIYGVAAFATNFDFLRQYGITLGGSALLQFNSTATPSSRRSRSRAFPVA